MQIVEIESVGGVVTEYVFIEKEDGTTVSMLKSIYDEQQAAQAAQKATK